MRIGVLTAGGDCPGLNAVIRSIVRTSAYEYDSQYVEVIGILDGFKGLVEGNYSILSRDSVAGILPRGGTILGASNRDNPFAYPTLNESGKWVNLDYSDKALANAKKWGLDALIVIGGDGSLTVGNRLHMAGLPVVGVPKTIDNDLSGTDQTFGFDTALTTVTDALDKLHTTADAHHRVMVVEVMGRYAGWIALYSALSGGADVALLPEMPFDMKYVYNKIKRRVSYGRNFSIVVVSEGAYIQGGDVVVHKIVQNSFESKRLGGIGQIVGDLIEENTGIETRVTTLGHIQRGGSPTSFDRILATRFGCEAVHQVMKGNTGCMVSLKTPDICTIPLGSAIEPKRVTETDPLVLTAKSIGMCFGIESLSGCP